MADLLLTGLPRSGSAAVSALIDTYSQAVCLNEPLWQTAFACNPLDALVFAKWLVGDFVWARQRMLRGEGLADIREADGRPLMDGRQEARMARNEAGDIIPVLFNRKGLLPDFSLAARHTTLFTAALPQIAALKHFRIIAVIRHPVDVCLSWKRLTQPLLSPGKPPGIARWWPEALAALGEGSVAAQLAALYELYLERYHSLREDVLVLRHEDIVADPGLVGRILGYEGVSAAAARLLAPNIRVQSRETTELSDIFRKIGVYSKLYYPYL